MPRTNRKKKSTATEAEATESKPNDLKPKIVHTKRQQILDSEGWTHVVDTPSRRNAPKHKAPFLQGGDFKKDGVSYVKRTLEELKTDYRYHKKQWEENAAIEDLKTKLETKEGAVEIKNVVCLGLGSFQSARREGRRASYTQLVALQSIIGILGLDQDLPFFFQDPQFTDLDNEFLKSLRYTVVQDPLAFRHITDNTLIYAIHCYADVYTSVCEAPRPAMLVATDVGNFGKSDLSGSIDTTARALEEMVNDCEEIDFPQVRHDFSDTKIYWRKTAVPAEASKAA